jgi:hypothetical protein
MTVPLFLPRIPVHVIPVLLPETRRILVKKFKSSHPLHRFPPIKMRHNQPRRITMVRTERLAIMMRRYQHLFPIQIRERHVGGISLLGMHQNITCFGSRLDKLEDPRHRHSAPPIVESTPARHTMKIAGPLHSRKLRELCPSPTRRIRNQSINAKIPCSRIKSRHRPVMQNRPLQGQGLPRRKPSLRLHPPLPLATLIAFKKHAE